MTLINEVFKFNNYNESVISNDTRDIFISTAESAMEAE